MIPRSALSQEAIRLEAICARNSSSIRRRKRPARTNAKPDEFRPRLRGLSDGLSAMRQSRARGRKPEPIRAYVEDECDAEAMDRMLPRYADAFRERERPIADCSTRGRMSYAASEGFAVRDRPIGNALRCGFPIRARRPPRRTA